MTAHTDTPLPRRVPHTLAEMRGEDPSPAWPGPYCEAPSPNAKGYICTREPGHAGDHVAHSGDLSAVDRWPQDTEHLTTAARRPAGVVRLEGPEFLVICDDGSVLLGAFCDLAVGIRWTVLTPVPDSHAAREGR